MKINEIESKNVFYYFNEISKIPRRSGNEEKIANYLVDFAKMKNFKVYKDNFNNVIIKKEADKGFEDKESLAFQAHMDMICEKTLNSNHDFSKDPLKLYIDGDYIKAKDTTLGADNGIGVALILALLDEKNIKTPKIEAIFTTEEETTMNGAINLDMNKIESNKIISLDNGKEGKILISSAICNEWKISLQGIKEKIKKDEKIYKLYYENFPGGHTGSNIGEEKRGNPLKLLAEALKNVNINIISIEGGSRVNVIPRNAKIVFICSEDNLKEIEKIIFEQRNLYKNYFQDINIEIKEIENSFEEKFDKESSKNIINFIYDYPNGVIKKDINNNIILTSSFADISTNNNEIYMETSTRCNYKKLNLEYLEYIQKIYNKYNVKIESFQQLKGIEPKENSNLVEKCNKVYYDLFKKNMEKVISQGGVEGGFMLDKKNKCEYVCIGPNNYNAHSPQEKLSISSTNNIWKFLLQIVTSI